VSHLTPAQEQTLGNPDNQLVWNGADPSKLNPLQRAVTSLAGKWTALFHPAFPSPVPFAKSLRGETAGAAHIEVLDGLDFVEPANESLFGRIEFRRQVVFRDLTCEF
jgi:hypothetical protein